MFLAGDIYIKCTTSITMVTKIYKKGLFFVFLFHSSFRIDYLSVLRNLCILFPQLCCGAPLIIDPWPEILDCSRGPVLRVAMLLCMSDARACCKSQL